MKLFQFLKTVKARLTLWNVLVLALVLLILGSVLRVTVAHNLMASVDENITSRARGSQWWWGQAFKNMANGRWHGPPPPLRNNTRRRQIGPRPIPPPSQWQARLEEMSLDVHGNRFFLSDREITLDQAAFDRAVTGQTVYSFVKIDDVRVRVVSAPIHGAGKIVGVVQVGYALDDVDRGLGNLDRTLLTLVPFALLAAGMGGLFLTGRMLRPLREVTQAASRIGAEDLSRRLPVSGGDEFSRLAATFNAMLARLEASFEQQRRFTGDASHELRTPLTVVKANTSLALSRGDLTPSHRKSLESIDKAASLMNRIIQDLLLLARSDAGELELNLRPTALSEVLETAVLCVESQKGAHIRSLAAGTPLMVLGDATHLTRLFVNLLDNAVRYTPAEGCVTLSVEMEQNKAIVTVQDTGIGITPEHIPHLCERFYRVDEARSRAQGGTGLGLAICQSIASAHGGSLDISSTPGVGTTVQVTLSLTFPSNADTAS